MQNSNTPPSALNDFKEFLSLLWVNITVQWRNFIEFLRVVIHYYPKLSFFKVDMTLLLTYLFNNPYVISKEFLKDQGEKNVYAYGETPLTTLDHIAKECQLSSSDTVYEVGSGRGRCCFWLNSFIKCNVVGIEYIPEFTTRSNEIKERFKLKNIQFLQQDMLKTNYSNATAIYLYGTTLDDNTIEQLIKQFDHTKPGTKIISISYPLTDYPTQSFELMKRFPVRFPWGTTDAYLQIRR